MQSLGKAPGTRETFLAVLDACDLMTQLQRVVGVCVIVVCVCVCVLYELAESSYTVAVTTSM